MNALEPLADVVLLVAPLIALGYVLSCAVWPFKACPRCEGFGHISGPFGVIRLCRLCDGTGLRLRFGRRVWNAFRRLYRDLNNRRNR